MSRIDLNLLRLFNVLVAEKSVTRAARRLNLTQSATSSALSRLRQALNDPLFIRTSEGLVPTAKAEALIEPVRQSLTTIEEAINEVADFNPAATKERFSLRAQDHTLRVLLPYLVPLLSKEAPTLELDLQPLYGVEVFQQLKVGELDIVISYFNGKDCDNLRFTRLFTERSVAIVANDHPVIKDALTLEQFAQAEHVVLRRQGTWLTSPIDRALHEVGKSRKVRMTIPGHLAAPLVVESSDMVATVPENFARRFEKEYKVKWFPLPISLPPIEVSMAWHERAQRNPAHRWLRNLISQFRDIE